MQSLNIKECKLLELQITQTRNFQLISYGKMSDFNTNHYEKFGNKEMKKFELQITQTRHYLSILDGKMSKFNIPKI